MYQTSRLPFSDSCTIIFPFCIDAFFIHAFHSSTIAPSHFIYHSCATVIYRIRYIAFMRRTHYLFMHCTHSSFMRRTHFSFIHRTHFSFIRCTHFSFMRRTHFSFIRRTYFSFMRCTHFLFMRCILPLPMYHIHGLMVTSLFLPLFMYQVELLAPR